MTLPNAGEPPGFILWDLTYACPLRCSFCYAEAGRRPSMELGREELMRVADALIEMHPMAVMLSGGEPLLVRWVFDVAARLSECGVPVMLYTGGWSFQPEMVPPILSLFSRVSVSIDGASAAVNDRIRGRAGAFDRALNALGHLGRGAAERRERGEPAPELGIEYVVMQSNIHEMHALCTEIAPRFPELDFISFGPVIPAGLATRAGFVEQEMLTEEQTRLLGEGVLERELQALAPPTVDVTTTDNRRLQQRPDLLAEGIGMPALHVDPDGMVRAMCAYEGTIGSLLHEEPMRLWERALERSSHPFVVEALGAVRTTREWAEAARRIDEHFGSPAVRARIARQPAYTRE